MKCLKLWVVFVVSITLIGARENSRDLWYAETNRDTLKIAHTGILNAYPDQGPRLSWNKQRLIGMGFMTLFAALSYYFHQQADEYYQQYLQAGSYHEIDRLFKKAQRFDRYAGWSYCGMELGFVFTVFTFDKESQ